MVYCDRGVNIIRFVERRNDIKKAREIIYAGKKIGY